MRKMLIVVGLLMACAVGPEVRQDGPFGPMPLKSEMAEGQRLCGKMCQESGMQFLEYMPDGRCVCRPEPLPQN